MKLLRQVSLYFQEGRSDKVYDVDLCEVGANSAGDAQYVVNFRYGRRGTALRDGTKTPAPVPLAKAEEIFDKLVKSKTDKGYRHASGSGPLPTPAEPSATSSSATPPILDPRARGVLARINAGADFISPLKLSRAVWRAGEMRLREAEPLLHKLLGAGDAQLDYCIAWALGRLGSANSAASLRSLQSSRNRPYMVRRIAAISLLELLDVEAQSKAIDSYISQLPGSLAELARTGPAEAFESALSEHLQDAEPSAYAALDVAYIVNNEHVRPALLNVARNCPLAPNYFQRIRHIFKAAELRGDAEMYGILARRFETTRGNVNSKSWSFLYDYVKTSTWRYERRPRENPLLGSKATAAFSHATRLYLRQRVWRTLKRLGELGMAEDYVRLATGVLAAISDDDAVQPYTSYAYRYERGRYQQLSIRYDRLHPFWAIGHILFGKSRRYRFEQSSRRICYYRLGDTPENLPTEREEAFPHLWDQVPQALLHLLDESRCLEVHQFAAKALRANREFCGRLDIAALLMLLRAPYEVTVELGFELAVVRFDATNPDRELVLALADCGYAKAREQACQWIDLQRNMFLADTAFAAALAAASHQDTRQFARGALKLVVFDDAAGQSLVVRLVAALQPLGEGEEQRAEDVCQTLREVFGDQLRRVGADVIRDLLAHPLSPVQRFAGDLLLNHETLAARPPDDVLQKLLEANEESIRAIGVRIVSGLPDDVLRNSPDLLMALARHPLEDVRANIRPTIVRLASGDPSFGKLLAQRFVDALLVPGAPEGVPTATAQLLRDDLRPYLGDISADTVWKLLQSRSAPAQEVGGLLLTSNVDGSSISVAQIVQLAGHDVLTVRQAAWQMCRDQIPRLKHEIEQAARIIDCDWHDSRQFAFELFREQFTADDFPTHVLVSVCDSVRDDVQQFGRDLVTRFFRETDGPEYMQRLSEHPSVSMQRFTSNYLDRYASNGHERLSELEPYFKSVLSRVNQGRIAKDRVFQLLSRELEKSPEHAQAIASVLARQSATSVIGDKARTIELMLAIRKRYPYIDLPLEIVPVEVRNGV